MVTPVGDLICFTSEALAGICRDSRFGTAITGVEIENSKPTVSAVKLRQVKNIFGKDNAFCMEIMHEDESEYIYKALPHVLVRPGMEIF